MLKISGNQALSVVGVVSLLNANMPALADSEPAKTNESGVIEQVESLNLSQSKFHTVEFSLLQAVNKSSDSLKDLRREFLEASGNRSIKDYDKAWVEASNALKAKEKLALTFDNLSAAQKEQFSQSVERIVTGFAEVHESYLEAGQKFSKSREKFSEMRTNWETHSAGDEFDEFYSDNLATIDRLEKRFWSGELKIASVSFELNGAENGLQTYEDYQDFLQGMKYVFTGVPTAGAVIALSVVIFKRVQELKAKSEAKNQRATQFKEEILDTLAELNPAQSGLEANLYHARSEYPEEEHQPILERVSRQSEVADSLLGFLNAKFSDREAHLKLARVAMESVYDPEFSILGETLGLISAQAVKPEMRASEILALVRAKQESALEALKDLEK